MLVFLIHITHLMNTRNTLLSFTAVTRIYVQNGVKFLQVQVSGLENAEVQTRTWRLHGAETFLGSWRSLGVLRNPSCDLPSSRWWLLRWPPSAMSPTAVCHMCNDVSRTYTITFGHVSRCLGRNLTLESPKLVTKLFTTRPRHSVDKGSDIFVGIAFMEELK